MFVKNPEYFLAIVKERSISKAADRLYLSQPYLSQYLAKLEANLGVTLLDRSHTPLRLTAAGELFHAYLERQGYLDRQLESDLQQLQEKKRQQLHIGVSTWRGSTLLPDIMRRFAAANITMNCQIVSCPGVNDGPALDRTLRELSEMYPSVASVAIVPVGVTKFRDGLCPIAPYTQEQAAAVIAQVEAFGKTFMEKHGTRLAWCSDEFYLLAGLPLPEKSFYEDMAQLENGVGMLRLLLSQADMALDEPEVGELVPFSVATGVSAAPFIDQILQKTKKQFPQLQGRVYPIRNRFFGETITVSGLVTGQDLIAQLKGQELGQRLFIPSNMLRAGESVFLDDVTVADVERELGVTVCPVDAESGFDLVDAMLGLPVTIQQTTPPGSDGEYYRYNPS